MAVTEDEGYGAPAMMRSWHEATFAPPTGSTPRRAIARAHRVDAR